jgi:hypothetical protein
VASQRRWLRKKTSRDYFRGVQHVRRVREWRKVHLGYWRKRKPSSQTTQTSDYQAVNPGQDSCNAPRYEPRTLQDFCLLQAFDFVGLIAMTTGSPLQEEGEATGRPGELIFHIFTALAQFERRLIQERTRAGLEAARARGRKGGRKPIAADDPHTQTAKKIHADKSLSIVSIGDICQTLRISRATFYRYLAAT